MLAQNNRGGGRREMEAEIETEPKRERANESKHKARGTGRQMGNFTGTISMSLGLADSAVTKSNCADEFPSR